MAGSAYSRHTDCHSTWDLSTRLTPMTSSEDSLRIHLFCTKKWKGATDSKSTGRGNLTVKVITVNTSVEGRLHNGTSLGGVERDIRAASIYAHKAAQRVHGATRAKIFSGLYRTTFAAEFARYIRESEALSEVLTNCTPSVTTHDHRSTALTPELFASGAITSQQHIRTNVPPYSPPITGDLPRYSRY